MQRYTQNDKKHRLLGWKSQESVCGEGDVRQNTRQQPSLERCLAVGYDANNVLKEKGD